ncbi:MAG: hypothetical protein DCE86_12355 [Flavobacteriaceae bacterium]|nr:MAG: hypothetical protein DCE86_12355 [Flavobacteriaceae bacterium]PZQ91009.1 MAG: hypothetical protein DI548_02540 [Flavobacterium johnsoniae]
MSIKSIKQKLIKESVFDEQWIKEAEYRIENEDWLDISFSIAVKTISAMERNGISQKQLAEQLGCTPQYVSKLLKGKEKLNIESIVKIGKILNVKLIEVPNEYLEYNEPKRIFLTPQNMTRLDSKLIKTFNYKEESSYPINFKSMQWPKKTHKTSCSHYLN